MSSNCIIMKLVITLLKILLFILLSTINFEYLLNRQSSTLSTILCIIIEIALVVIIIIPLIKKLFK